MEDKNTDREYELKAHMRDLERQQDELETMKKEIWQREDDEDTDLIIFNRSLEQMGDVSAPTDKVILGLIEEKKQMVRDIRNRKAEFVTELEDELKKKRQQIEWELKDTQKQLMSIQIQREEENEKRHSNTEEKDRKA